MEDGMDTEERRKHIAKLLADTQEAANLAQGEYNGARLAQLLWKVAQGTAAIASMNSIDPIALQDAYDRGHQDGYEAAAEAYAHNTD